MLQHYLPPSKLHADHSPTDSPNSVSSLRESELSDLVVMLHEDTSRTGGSSLED